MIHVISGLVLFSALLVGSLLDEPRPPDSEEQKQFQAKIATLQKHTPLLPEGVYHVIASLTDTVLIVFDCPDSAQVTQVHIEVTTRQIKWDRGLTIGGKRMEIAPQAVAYYIWRPAIVIHNHRKLVRATNYIMLAPEILSPRDSTKVSPLRDEAMLYHELLHGQLLINAMTDSAWQARTCDCDFDLAPRDAEHETIPDLVFGYLANLAEVYGDYHVVEVPPRSTFVAGQFEVAIGDTGLLGEKSEWEARYYYPERANIEPNSFEIKISKGRIWAVGRLVDPTRRGFAIVRFTPKR